MKQIHKDDLKDIKYNKDHPRPQLGSGIDIGDVPRTIDADIPPLELVKDSPFEIEGTDRYKMGDCTVVHRIEEEGGLQIYRLSISHKDRYPTWDEVAEARYRLIPDDVHMVMPLPPMEEYLNIHPYMFNLIGSTS